MKRMLMLVNPNAGKEEIRAKGIDIIDLFTKHGWEVTVHTTQRQGEIPDFLRERAGEGEFPLVVCCGGDGTLNETVDGLLACPKPPVLGYLPAGTVNDFASSLGIPKDLDEAAKIVVSGECFDCDVGTLGGRVFTYIAAFGAFTDVAYQTPQQTKNLLGRAAYFLEAIKRLPNITPYHVTIESEHGLIEDDFIFGMVTNSVSVGGFKAGEQFGVSMNDGLLEGVFLRAPKSVAEMNQLINAVLRRELDYEAIVTLRTTHLHLHSSSELPWTLDGECGGDVPDADIRVRPRALRILADTKKAPSGEPVRAEEG